MNERLSVVRDRTMGVAGTILSVACVVDPKHIGRRVVGNDPRVTPVVYWLSSTRPRELGSNMITFHRDEKAPEKTASLPKDYEQLGVILGDAALLGEYRDHFPNDPLAFAWTYGKHALMVATLPDDHQHLPTTGDFPIGSKVGPRDNRVSFGFVHGLRGFQVVNGSLRADNEGQTIPLAKADSGLLIV